MSLTGATGGPFDSDPPLGGEFVEATADDLTRPLGAPKTARRRLSIRVPVKPILGAALVLSLGSLATFIALVRDPLGGEPHAFVPITTAEAPAAGDPAAGPQTSPNRRGAETLEQASGVSVVRQGVSGAGEALIITIPDAEPKRRDGPDPGLLEKSRHGNLPRIGADGTRPADAYARPAPTPPGRVAGRVALVVTGLGIGASATAHAIDKLPSEVSLAFAPYGGDLERQSRKAREDGHEILLQVPMEPFDYPANDPGPQTLTAAAEPADNLNRLHWSMGRLAGYVGIVNYMGGRLTSDANALTPVLKEVAKRGLVFLDDGSSSRSLASSLAPGLNAPVARADGVVDAVADAEAIDRELAALESTAKSKGLAVGSASALPLTVDRIARWAKQLESRGILLVPVTSAYGTTRP